jgi:chromosome segregation ATPase
MKIDKTNILLMIIAIFAVYNIFTINRIRTDISGYNKKIDIIQKEIDSVHLQNKSISKQISSLDLELSNLDDDILNVTKKINTIKIKTDEKVERANYYTADELTRLFSNRYDSTTIPTNSKDDL